MTTTTAASTCEHWERTSPMFNGHCSHASCPNYADSCPVHQNYGYPDPHGLPAGECTLRAAEATTEGQQ